MKVTFYPRFTREVDEQFSFFRDRGYKEGNPNLAKEFIDDTQKAIEHIKANPQTWPKVSPGIRRIHLKNFRNHAIRYRYSKAKGTIYLTRLTHSAQKS